jgi:hypothetical protein
METILTFVDISSSEDLLTSLSQYTLVYSLLLLIPTSIFYAEYDDTVVDE